MKNIGVNDLKKYLKDMNAKELQEEILNLFKSFPEVKQLYSSKLNPDFQQELLENYKKIISKEFSPYGNRLSLNYKICRDAISSFQKVCMNPDLVAELMFHYAEEGIEFTENFGDIDEQFYNNIFKAYNNAIEYAFNNNIEEKYKKRALKMMETCQDYGWGFGDALVDCYYDYYGSDDEDE